MRTHLGNILTILAYGIVSSKPVQAQALRHTCVVQAKSIKEGQPFLLADPRSGLMLYLESDGRHMAAITRDGKILWHRNLFDNPSLEAMFPPPPQIDLPGGKDTLDPKDWEKQVRSIIAGLAIDSITIEPDCHLH